MLARSLNEIHKCVLPKEKEFRVLKTPEEVKASALVRDAAELVERKDPRSNRTRLLQPSHKLIKDYGYSSELTPQEHQQILNSINLRIIHNPSLVKQKLRHLPTDQISAETREKHRIEITHFNKCAEIFFHRNISEHNSLVPDNMKPFLIDRWRRLRSDDDERRFQVITRLLRDQVSDGADVEFVQTSRDNFTHGLYLISSTRFPSLHRFTVDELKFYDDMKSTRRNESASVDECDCDAMLSLELLVKLLIDSEEFSARFNNRETSDGRLISQFEDAVPLKPVSIEQALQEIVQTSMRASIDWSNLEDFVKPSTVDEPEYKVERFDLKMRKIFARFLATAGPNEVDSTWILKNKLQSVKLRVTQPNVYFSKTDESLVPTNISIKLEYQTKFGAERMTREELLKEWCMQRFNVGSKTFRYRVDAATLRVLSITQISFEDIERELSDRYKFDPAVSLGNLVNLLSCTKRLPPGDYSLMTKIEETCKNLYIFKSSDSGKLLQEGPWEISTQFSKMWIAIDESTPSFLHMNHNFSPSCFPFQAYGCRKRKLSYFVKKKPPKKKQKAGKRF